ncbi:uncharacterized protein G2W53_032920 [Senna tora]|uniref:Uncharacterized protein n=1 Tax=Senna tora TaxID=362788 RepID=A0A834SXJ0_9FABA|nr:uncharacterized protein G2W53_032920 [Senna tora]
MELLKEKRFINRKFEREKRSWRVFQQNASGYSILASNYCRSIFFFERLRNVLWRGHESC